MNRDQALFALIGVLTGFIAGYLMHEVMAARQPALRVPSAAQVQNPHLNAGSDPASAQMAEIARLTSRVEQNPDDAQAVLVLANLNFEIRNWERARDLYSRYLTLEPENPDVITDLGVCFRELGQFDRALELFDRAQALAPEHWQSLYNEVVVRAFDLGQPETAGETLERLRALQPDNPSVERLASEVGQLAG